MLIQNSLFEILPQKLVQCFHLFLCADGDAQVIPNPGGIEPADKDVRLPQRQKQFVCVAVRMGHEQEVALGIRKLKAQLGEHLLGVLPCGDELRRLLFQIGAVFHGGNTG